MRRTMWTDVTRGSLRNWWLSVAMIALACAATSAAGPPAAAPGPARQPQGQRGTGTPPAADDTTAAADAVPTAELVNMLDTYAIVQAQRALALGDDQYGSFVTRLRKLQETRRRSQRERNQIVQDLRRLTGPRATAPADETTLRDRLRTLRDHDERAAVEMRKAYEAVDEILTVQQQARFRVFEETIERRKLDLLVRARERAAGRGGRQ